MEDQVDEPTEAEEATEEKTYTEEELKTYRDLFNRFDQDNNDSIEPTELGKALRYIGCNPTESECKLMIAEADAKSNANGRLEFDEFCEIIAKNRKTMEEEEAELRAAFKIFDKDGNGWVDREELKATVKQGGFRDMTDEEIDLLMDAADDNGDGKLNYDELVRMMTGGGQT